VGEAAGLVYERLAHLTPTKASVEFGVSFSVQGGKLTALLFDGKADASLTIGLEWESPGAGGG
ncbi:MAG: CU044_2847 family protein, partial [Solirubrobacteraceae bacterium]